MNWKIHMWIEKAALSDTKCRKCNVKGAHYDFLKKIPLF